MRKRSVLIVVETSRAFGRGVLQGIARHMVEHDEWIVHVEDRGLLETIPSWLRTWKGDGIITRTSSPSIARIIRNKRIPVVELLGNGIQVQPEIRNDEDCVAKLVVEHFVQVGFSDFAFFAIGNVWWSLLRQEAFVRTVKEHAGTVHVFPKAGAGKRVFYPEWAAHFDGAMLKWLRLLPKPVAVWAVSDALAIRLLEGCRRLDLHVPEEVAILGTTNDTLLCNTLTPPLSSVDLNASRIGYLAAERLAKKMRGEIPELAPVLVAPIGVVPRQSTDIVAFPDRQIAMAVRLIRTDATLGLSVDSVAESIGMSRRTLQRRFQTLLGHSVEKEIIKTRMNRAKRLLRETDFSLAAITLKIGFSTVDYFVQAFKREIGITPGQYRQEVQETVVGSEKD